MKRLCGWVVAGELAALTVVAWRIHQALKQNTDQAAARANVYLPKLVEQAELELDEVQLLDELRDRIVEIALTRAGAVEDPNREHHSEHDNHQPGTEQEYGDGHTPNRADRDGRHGG